MKLIISKYRENLTIGTIIISKNKKSTWQLQVNGPILQQTFIKFSVYLSVNNQKDKVFSKENKKYSNPFREVSTLPKIWFFGALTGLSLLKSPNNCCRKQ